MAKDRRNKNITRVDTGATHGYQVRMRREKKSFDKFFSDSRFDGKRGSLEAAREYRDKLNVENPISRKNLTDKKAPPPSSGVRGVRLEYLTVANGGYETTYGFWVAQWSPEPGVRKTRRFSVDKYGDAEAFRLAVEAREKGVESMIEYEYAFEYEK